MTNPTDNIRPRQITLAITDPEKFNLLKKYAQELKKAETKDMRFKKPKPNCKHCYGRGHVGYFDINHKVPVPCRCVYVVKPMGIQKGL